MSDLRAALERYLSERLGEAVAAGAPQRISVGHSRAMYLLPTDHGRFVVRVEQGGVFGTSGASEYAVMQALHDAGVPVARPRWLEPTGDVLGQPFFVMDHVASTPQTDERSMDAPTAERFVAALDAMHRSAWSTGGPDGLPFVEPPADDPHAATRRRLRHWLEIARGAAESANPLLEEGASWLDLHAPPAGRIGIVHGDAGPGNVLVLDGRIAAITDFEFSHLGDPMEDWSFCSAMRGSRTMPRTEWYAIFERSAGVVAPPEAWAYWEAFNLFKGACANVTCLDLFRRGVNRAPNMAIIGTALHHSFLRRLVAITAHPTPADAAAASSTTTTT